MELTNQLNVFNASQNIFNSEWLETNGLGTWAAGSVSGMNRSRYHGLLIANNQKGEPISLLSKLEETVIVNGEKINLSVNQYPGALYPEGYKKLISFKRKLFPEFIYQAKSITLKKIIASIHGSNTVLVMYELLDGAEKISMELLPMISSRSTNELTYENEAISKIASFNEGSFFHHAYPNNPSLHIYAKGASYRTEPVWYKNIEYEIERMNGEFYREDLFSPGRLTIELHKNEMFGVIISDQNLSDKNPIEMLKNEANRRSSILSEGKNEVERKVRLAADQFLVKPTGTNFSIKGGYFSLGYLTRDTLISLPGLLLSTQKYEEAKNILQQLGKHFKKGLLPEQLFSKQKEYVAADIPLWYFNSTYQYFKFTEDTEFIFNEVMPIMKDVIAWYLKGSNNNICVDNDGLVIAGTTDRPATWMNACCEGWAITPRAGKAVEINALWYNALKIYAYFLDLKGQNKEVSAINDLSDGIKKRFNTLFWNKNGKFLYDLIDETHFKNDRVRPNQLFALSLSFPIISGKKAQHVLNKIEQKLLTNFGIRTLSADAMEFKASYEGNMRQRKLALHEGTVWNWLLGPYIDALINLRGNAGKVQALMLFNNLKAHLENSCIGNISALFNASGEHSPAGYHAYALSVAEILRVGIQHSLFDLKPEDLITEKVVQHLEEDEKFYTEEEELNNEKEELPENEYHEEDVSQFNNPFSVISAFRSPGNKFSRIFSLYNFG